jgi:hypothetical protein
MRKMLRAAPPAIVMETRGGYGGERCFGSSLLVRDGWRGKGAGSMKNEGYLDAAHSLLEAVEEV